MERSSVLKNIQATVLYRLYDQRFQISALERMAVCSKHPDYTVGWCSGVPTLERVSAL
jgi:hypothetical protein